MPTILLIRHGESQANAGLPTAYPKDIELTKRGQEDAECVAREMQKSYPSLDLIITSDCLRTVQTAGCTLQLLRDRQIPVNKWPVQEFTYLSMWSKRISTVKDRSSAVHCYWKQADPQYTDGPGTESFQKFIERVRTVRNSLNTATGTVAVFSHHQFICALVWLSQQDTLTICAQTMRTFKAFLDTYPLANGAIVRVQFERGGGPWRSEILTSHLPLKDSKPVLSIS